jgi:hypothetical protein
MLAKCLHVMPTSILHTLVGVVHNSWWRLPAGDRAFQRSNWEFCLQIPP